MSNKRKTATMIFLNGRNEVLMFLRDDKPSIKYPNMWDLPGGQCDGDESAEQCIRREMAEELPDLVIDDVRLFMEHEFSDRIDTIFWTRKNIHIDTVNEVLTEGQRAEWFSSDQAQSTEIAFEFGPIVEKFFEAVQSHVLR